MGHEGFVRLLKEGIFQHLSSDDAIKKVEGPCAVKRNQNPGFAHGRTQSQAKKKTYVIPRINNQVSVYYADQIHFNSSLQVICTRVVEFANSYKNSRYTKLNLTH